MASTEESIKAYLDSLSQLPGSILFRNDVAWEGLPPGNAGEQLVLGPDSKPAWGSATGYNPALMAFPNDADFYHHSITTAGRQMRFVADIRPVPQSEGISQFLTSIHDGSAATRRAQIGLVDADHSTLPNVLLFVVYAPASTQLARWEIQIDPNGENRYRILAAYDGASGDGVFIVNGTSIAPIQLDPGSPTDGAGTIDVATAQWSTGREWHGDVGYFGYADVYDDNYDDFFDQNNNPRRPDINSWGQWGSQPKVWNEACNLIRNYGTAGDFSVSGQPFVALSQPA